MPDSPSAVLPDLDALAMVLIPIALVFIYLDFFPNTTSPVLQWVLKVAGPWRIHLVVQGVFLIHAIEALVSVYLTVIVGHGFFQTVDIVLWALLVLVFGYPCLFHLSGIARRQQQQRAAGKETSK
jgi:hypothetical protein